MTSEPSNPFLKQLASSNRRIRDAALESLRAYLERSTPLTELEYLKLWKGLFFCMWMSDKALTQQRLARDLADLVNVLRSKEHFLRFVGAFWKTMAREWGGIDALRMDKFLYLVRCYVHEGFNYVSRSSWTDEDLLDAYLNILRGVPFNATDGRIPNGLKHHVLDIYVDELEKTDLRRTAPIEKLMAPLHELARDTPVKSVRVRAKEAMDDERLKTWDGQGVEEPSENTEEINAGKISTSKPGRSRVTAGHEDDASDDEFDGFGD